jgi:hypothetical protein
MDISEPMYLLGIMMTITTYWSQQEKHLLKIYTIFPLNSTGYKDTCASLVIDWTQSGAG